MVGELITLPLRVTARAAHLWWRAADEAVGLGWSAAGYVIERVTPVGSHARDAEPRVSAPEARAVRPAAPSPAPSAQPSPTEHPPSRPAVSARVPEPPPTPSEGEPGHVSEEPELVEELAEPGAEDGAGPELHIREPWEGYRHMSAREVTAKLPRASAAELVAVQLYENSHRGRQTILAAAARHLKTAQHESQLSGANGSGSQP